MRIPPARSERRVRLIFFAIAALNIAIGLWQLLAPRGFYNFLVTYDLPNDHFVRVISAFHLALAVMLIISIRRRQWRVSVLLFATLWFAFHAVAALIDISGTDPEWLGYFLFIALTLIAGVLAWLTGYTGGVLATTDRRGRPLQPPAAAPEEVKIQEPKVEAVRRESTAPNREADASKPEAETPALEGATPEQGAPSPEGGQEESPEPGS